MSDNLDRASDYEEQERAAAVTKRRPQGPVPTGYCHNCDEPLADDHSRWCGVECREDYERRVRR